jgi:hypothetical protein
MRAFAPLAPRLAWPWLLVLWGCAAGTPWRAVAPEAVPPLPPAQAAAWPAELAAPPVAAGEVQPKSLGLLLRFLQPKPSAETPHWPEAAALRGRVAEAVAQAAPAAFARTADGRFAEQPGGDAARDALADTISTALHQARHGPQPVPPERVAHEVRGLLRALHDDRTLGEARALARRQAGAAAGAATLADVDSVRLLEAPGQPTTLWLLLRAAPARPLGLVARVNLDEVLARVGQRRP